MYNAMDDGAHHSYRIHTKFQGMYVNFANVTNPQTTIGNKLKVS